MSRTGMIFDASSIAEQLRQYNVNYEGRRTYDQLHLENQQFAAEAQGAITQKYSTQLEQAYNTSLQQQASIAGTRLGQGQKNLLTDKLQQATSSAYQAATSEALQYQQKLNEQVSTQAANIEGALYQKGKNQADLLNATVDYWSEQVENNPDLMNDPLWSKYFVNLGLDALDETERARYEELERKNLNLIEDARRNVSTFTDKYTGEKTDPEKLKAELQDLTPERLAERRAERLAEYEENAYQRLVEENKKHYKGKYTEKELRDLAKNTTKQEGHWAILDLQDDAYTNVERRQQIQDMLDEHELLTMKSDQDASLLENKELEEYTALRDKVMGRTEGSRRAMTKDELMAQMVDVDEEGNFDLNMAGQDFFDMMFGEKVDESSFGRWLNESNPDLYEFFTSSDQFDYRNNQTQIRDMLGIGTEMQDYQYSFLERMGGMSEGQLRQTFDVFGASIENLAFGKDTMQNISKLSGNVTGLMQGLGIDADFERETRIKMTELDKGIKTAIENIVSGKDINAAVAGTVLANLGGGMAGGAATGGFAGPTGALVGTIVGGIFGLIKGISTASKDAKNKKDSNKRIKLMIQRQYSKMMNELTLYMQERAQEAEDKFEKSIRRF